MGPRRPILNRFVANLKQFRRALVNIRRRINLEILKVKFRIRTGRYLVKVINLA